MTPRKPALGFIFVTLVLDVLGIGLIIPILPKIVGSFQRNDLTAAAPTFGLLAARSFPKNSDTTAGASAGKVYDDTLPGL